MKVDFHTNPSHYSCVFGVGELVKERKGDACETKLRSGRSMAGNIYLESCPKPTLAYLWKSFSVRTLYILSWMKLSRCKIANYTRLRTMKLFESSTTELHRSHTVRSTLRQTFTGREDLRRARSKHKRLKNRGENIHSMSVTNQWISLLVWEQ